MTYRVKYTDETKSPLIIQDGDIETSTNLGLVGRGYTGFGEVVAENFLHLLENFSDETPPSRPTEGQLWYNNTNSSMYYYTVAETWKKIGNVRAEPREPILNDGEVNGDIWLDLTTNNMYIYSSPNWILMANGDIGTKVYSRTRRDNKNPIGLHKTLEMVVNGKVVAVFSSDLMPWTPNSTGSNAEYLDDGTLMANVYSSIKLGINLINRNITEVTVSTTNPTEATTSIYVQEGDMWVNKTTNRLFTYASGSWKRINNYVKVRGAAPVLENDEQVGDLWIDTLINKIYYYNSISSSWELLAANTTFSTTSPTSSDIKNAGDYWVNTSTLQLYSYNGSEWLNLSFQEKGTFVITKDRLDSNNVSHKTLETIIGGKTVSVESGDTSSWVPNSSETLYEGGSYAEKFLKILPGKNMSNEVGEIIVTTEDGTAPSSPDYTVTEYDIWKNYGEEYNSRIKVRNATAWITPNITYNNTAPTSPVKYGVWITLTDYEIKVYNGSLWIYPANIFDNGKTVSTSTSTAKLFNGIATKQAISGTQLINYNQYTVGTTFTNGTSLVNGSPVTRNNAASVSVYLYPRQWQPIIKGNITFQFDMDALTEYEYRISRRPIDSDGNALDDHILQVGSWSGPSTSVSRTLVIPFIDVVSVYLPSYYPDNSMGPYRVKYVLQLKKTGTSMVTSYISVDLQPLYDASYTSSQVGIIDQTSNYIYDPL